MMPNRSYEPLQTDVRKWGELDHFHKCILAPFNEILSCAETNFIYLSKSSTVYGHSSAWGQTLGKGPHIS